MATNAGFLSADVSKRLSQLERTIRGVNLLRGVGLVLTVFCLLLAGGLLIDYLFDFGTLARGLMLASVLVGTVITFWRGLVRPAMYTLDQTELAAMIETANPNLDEGLTSVIELNDASVPEQYRGSEVMRARLEKQVRGSMKTVNFSTAVSAGPMQKWLAAAAVACVMLVVPLFAWPDAYPTLLQRFFQPWANIQRVTNLHFEVPNGNRMVAKGSDVEITAMPQWRSGEDHELPATVVLNQTDLDGKTHSRRMHYREDDQAFVVSIPHVLQPFGYNITAESARSEEYAIDVAARPEITTVGLDVEPPPYTGLSAKLIDGAAGQIDVFEHSQLAFDIEFSKPVVSGELVWLSGVDFLEDDEVVASATKPGAMSLQLSDDRTRGTLKMQAERSGRFELKIVDDFGLQNDDQADRYLAVIRDQPPTLDVAGSDAPDEAHPSDVIPVRVAAADDIGLGELELHIDIGHNEQNRLVVRKMEGGPNGDRDLTHEFKLNLSEFEIAEGMMVAWRVRAADERPVPGPNETWSDRRFLTITSDAAAPGAQQLAFEQNEMKTELERIIKKIEQNRDVARAMKSALWKPGRQQNDPEDNKQLEQLAAEQAELIQELETLNDRLAEHPLFENLVENAREVSRDVLPEATQQFEEARKETANKGNRANSLTKAERKLNEASWKLQNVAREFDKLAELERDLLELQRMANQAEQVADKAVEVEKERIDVQAMPEGPDKEHAENALAMQQQNVSEEQQDLSQELDDLLDRRPELIEAAKRAQLEKLQELAEQARQLIEPQQQLEQAFREEGNDAARDAQQLSTDEQKLLDKASELTRMAQQAGASDPKAVEQAMREAMEALKKGDLATAQEKQEAAQAQLNQQANAARTPDDPQKAVEEMMGKQKEIARDLQEQADAGGSPEQKSDELDRLVKEQSELNQSLKDLNLPKPNQDALDGAIASVDEAVKKVEEMAKQGDTAGAAKKAEDVAEMLKDLSQQLPSKEEVRQQAAEQVAELRKQQEANRQQTQQNGASQAAKQEQQKITEELADLIAPNAAQEANDALEKSASASRELERNDAADAVKEQLETEQQLARMQEKLAGKETSDERLEKLQKEQQQVAEDAKQAFDQQAGNDGQPKDGDQDAAREAAKKAAKEATAAQAKQQQQIAEELAELDTPAAEPQRQAAESAASEAARQLNEGDQQGAESAMQKSQEAMQDLAESLGSPSKTSEQPPQRQEPTAEQKQQFAEQAERLSKEIARANEKLEQTRQERLAENDAGNSPEGGQENKDPAAGQNPPESQQANQQDPQNSGPGEQPQDPVEQTLQEQREIAEDAAKLSQDIAEQNGEGSDAANKAQTMAAEARSAAMHAQAGRFNAAREINKAGAREADSTKQELENSEQPAPGDGGENGPSNQQLAQRAEDLAEQMQQASEKMDQMSDSPSQRNQAQVGQQEAIKDATQEIADAMQAAAERLESAALNMDKQGESGQQASQAAQQASQAQQQAQQQAAQGDANAASESAKQAVESLQQAAQQAQQAASDANKFQDSPVPNEVGTQVADAVEQLRKAAEQLAEQMNRKGEESDQQMAQSNSESSQQQPGGEGQDSPEKGQPGDSPDGEAGQEGQQPGQDGKPGQGKDGQGKEGEGKDGKGKPSNKPGQGKPGGQPSESMQNAAQSLADAAKNSQPAKQQGKNGRPQQNDQLSENMNEPSELPEGVSQEDLQKLLPGLNQPGGKRNWGKLPGTLKTEIIQAAKKNPNGEYARLIKLYFKEIAGSGEEQK